MLYGYPELGRYGLGHGLSAWARCVVWSHRTGTPMLAPQWLTPRIGPYLRRERDKRNYFLLFTSKGYVTGPKRWFLLTAAHRLIAGPDIWTNTPSGDGNTLVVFKNALADNEKKHFHEIRDHYALLGPEIRRITRPAFLPAPFEEPTIAMHIRMGDFTASSTVEELRAGRNNSRVPLSWYIETLQKVRAAMGRDAPAVIFSDGPDEALAEILSLPQVRRARPAQSITDMLSIANADLLIASGSGFSVWGRFFGQVPSVSHPGQKVVDAVVSAPEIECGADEPLPEDFLQVLAARFNPTDHASV